MIEILNQEEVKKKKGGGKPNILSIEDRLLMALEYLREYRTYFQVSQSYGVTESTCHRNCRWIEDVLIKSGKFSLPGKKELLKSNIEYEVILINASESPIERPKKRIRNKERIKNRNNKQKHYYSGKKKRHTLKSQIVVDKKSKKIICTACCNGKKHDFKLFKESKVRWTSDCCEVTDSGYTGIKKIQKNSKLPKKSSKNNPLTKSDKEENRKIS
jgi:hypothetical protein